MHACPGKILVGFASTHVGFLYLNIVVKATYVGTEKLRTPNEEGALRCNLLILFFSVQFIIGKSMVKACK